ncbi:ABC transporter permease [Aureimonas phyllosphaerae]|uniref:Peptide/nickel transport system permease protein n=1 Tax=Aureimonas phyllosphaerae TaxID=1166078 RepID=A0A7W6FUD6_9HYPH|nr:ABC transporter permease [Aureimonas phyllosphaerae]MBB3934907.1 peptide/nickel transport system permease protein [Aureimonas phyllosphaerae]MBB3958915.1 peptide/nickel transport system permease protein [Aureimonas phyllosphaerae]SFF40780.1 peptide/nickel transport system permease protein [Aureimonas phyllosphaerae]
MTRRWNLRLAIGGSIVALLSIAAVLAPFWTPVAAPLRLRIGARLDAPLTGGLFGTDQLGRDVLSLLMLGAGNSLATAATAILIAACLGGVLGLLAAEIGDRSGGVLMRATDVLFAFPPLLSAMMLAAALGTGFWSATVAIALFTLPVFARVTSATTASVLARDFVTAARALGRSGPAIARRHVLPNIAGTLAIQVSLQMGLAILTEAGLGYLGLGRPPPTPSWGRMLADAQTYMGSAPWLALAPGCTIALAVLGFNLLGDGLRDWLDPRTRR